MTPYILIGNRDGVLWRCYREPGESEAEWQERAETMRKALEEPQS